MEFLRRFAAAIAFYTVLPVPMQERLDFQQVARFAPYVGILLGGLLGLLDYGLAAIGLALLTRSAVVVIVWIAITGGLHLDGAMDTADGLAVTNPDRRLEVMADSATGAFGGMAAIAIVLLKTCALSDVSEFRGLVLVAAAGWGRWGQQMAIARYPYLKATGKGSFHKLAIRSVWDTLPAGVVLVGIGLTPGIEQLLSQQAAAVWNGSVAVSVAMVLGGSAIAILVAAWFNFKLGGHTGDTYGAIVEWTEALLLTVLSLF
jgi:adenosylcobinamide-GDP ribazoletransferase